MPGSEPRCRYNCGFQGSISQLVAHEQVCRLRQVLARKENPTFHRLQARRRARQGAVPPPPEVPPVVFDANEVAANAPGGDFAGDGGQDVHAPGV